MQVGTTNESLRVKWERKHKAPKLVSTEKNCGKEATLQRLNHSHYYEANGNMKSWTFENYTISNKNKTKSPFSFKLILVYSYSNKPEGFMWSTCWLNKY